MIIPEWLKDELEGKKYTPKGIPKIIDQGVRTTWEIPGLIGDMLNRNRGQGLKGGLAPRMSHVREQDAAIRAAGAQGIGGTPQTRPHDYFTSESDGKTVTSESDRKTDLLAPNTNERNTSSNPVKIPEVEKGGTRWVGGNSTWVSGRTGDVIAPNIKDLPKEQVPSVLRSDGKGLESVSKIQKEIAKPGIIESLKIKGAELFNQGKETISNAIASLPKAEQIKKVGMFDGTKAGTVKGLNTASAIIGALDTIMKKNKKPNTAGMEGKGGNIDQVAVAAGIDPEDFYRAV